MCRSTRFHYYSYIETWELHSSLLKSQINGIKVDKKNVQFMNTVYYHGYKLSEQASETWDWDSAEYLLKQKYKRSLI